MKNIKIKLILFTLGILGIFSYFFINTNSRDFRIKDLISLNSNQKSS